MKNLDKDNVNFGIILSGMLEKMEPIIWEYEDKGNKPNYTDMGVRSGIKLITSILLDKFTDKCERDNLPPNQKNVMLKMMGDDVRNLIMKYTDIDTLTLY